MCEHVPFTILRTRPRVSLIMHRFNYAGSFYNICTKGLFEGKCPGVQGHDDLVQVQYKQCRLFISESPPCRCMLFSKEETKEALQKIKEKPECNVIYRPPPEPDLGPHSLEEYAFIMLPHIRPPVINHTNSCLVEKPQLHTIIGSG